MTPPTARRPHMPGYGIVPADDGEGLLPWSWATDRLDAVAVAVRRQRPMR